MDNHFADIQEIDPHLLRVQNPRYEQIVLFFSTDVELLEAGAGWRAAMRIALQTKEQLRKVWYLSQIQSQTTGIHAMISSVSSVGNVVMSYTSDPRRQLLQSLLHWSILTRNK